jgi:hypothetical protein
MTGDRLKEVTASANRLSVLLNVIESLAHNMADKEGKRRVVPYRDSCLTRYLQNSFLENSKTSMIFSISPASCNHEETLSTLRYADKVRKVANRPIFNLCVN